jgi:hypothetical protein
MTNHGHASVRVYALRKLIRMYASIEAIPDVINAGTKGVIIPS